MRFRTIRRPYAPVPSCAGRSRQPWSSMILPAGRAVLTSVTTGFIGCARHGPSSAGAEYRQSSSDCLAPSAAVVTNSQ